MHAPGASASAGPRGRPLIAYTARFRSIGLDNAQLTAGAPVLVADGVGADGVTPATATLRGALLNPGPGSSVSLSGGGAEAHKGEHETLRHGVSRPLIEKNGGSHNLGAR